MTVGTGPYQLLWWSVDPGPLDRGTFDLQESVKEVLEAIEVFSGDLKQKQPNTASQLTDIQTKTKVI